MNTVILTSQTALGETLQASFLPESGMNMISYKKDNVEIIDPTTRSLFEERYAGLGALIGPHFHRRRPETLPRIKDESIFPHIARVKAKGNIDPFSHGIARYAPWKYQETKNSIKGTLTGKDLWNGVALSELEGQNFTMTFAAELTPAGLTLNLSVISDTDSLVGIHYYYRLPNGVGTVKSRISPFINVNGEKHSPPSSWHLDNQKNVEIPLDQALDCTLHPFPDQLRGKILLETSEYHLMTTYQCISQENCWQLYHPEGASYVCIEPISAQDPRHPNLTVSSLNINLQIFSPGQQYE
ncbi:MAG: hypothetical protein H0X51_00830 [Parachlamydiaceae bacterium]|nr:hypothetical protein [Parachlamydiaceae bacterium]